MGGDYVGLLLLGAFAAAIHKADMRGAFKYDPLVRPSPAPPAHACV